MIQNMKRPEGMGYRCVSQNLEKCTDLQQMISAARFSNFGLAQALTLTRVQVCLPPRRRFTRKDHFCPLKGIPSKSETRMSDS